MNYYHRYFIQYMIKNSVSTLDDAMEFCKYISKELVSTPVQFKTLVAEINKQISVHSFKLVLDICEVTNQDVIVWINTKNDKISKLQSTFTAVELEYFNAILEEILNAENHGITFIVSLNITSSLTGSLSRTNGQKVLDKWIKIGYFVKNGDYIHLGPRLILEFSVYLKNHCPDSLCNLCSELVFVGRQCDSCGKILHSNCMTKYLERQNKCPCCQSTWIDRNVFEQNHINNVLDDEERMEVHEEVPEHIFEDYTQLTQEYENSQTIENHSQNTSPRNNLTRLRTRRTTEEDLLEAGPSTRY